MKTALASLFLLVLAGTSTAWGEIFRWKDADGRIQFSDHPPADTQNGVQDLSTRYARGVPFSFRIMPMGYDMRPDTRVKVQVAVEKIYEILQSRLGVGFRSDPSFDLRIFGDKESFASYGNGPPLAGLASGYYVPRRNEAVTWRQHSFEQMLEVITHEANHALLHHRFGDIPPWLNEGLSEYVERMEVFGMAVVIHPNDQWDRIIKQQVRDGSIRPLREYLALSQARWQLHNLAGNRSYAQAWSFVYFLMSSTQGTRLLGQLLDTLARVGAEDFSAADVIDANFEGGLAALETNWLAWSLGPKQAHHY